LETIVAFEFTLYRLGENLGILASTFRTFKWRWR